MCTDWRTDGLIFLPCFEFGFEIQKENPQSILCASTVSYAGVLGKFIPCHLSRIIVGYLFRLRVHVPVHVYNTDFTLQSALWNKPHLKKCIH